MVQHEQDLQQDCHAWSFLVAHVRFFRPSFPCFPLFGRCFCCHSRTLHGFIFIGRNVHTRWISSCHVTFCVRHTDPNATSESEHFHNHNIMEKYSAPAAVITMIEKIERPLRHLQVIVVQKKRELIFFVFSLGPLVRISTVFP